MLLVRVFLRYFGLDMHNTHSEISKRKYSKVIWEKRLLPHHGHALPKCTSKIQSDYVFSLFFNINLMSDFRPSTSKVQV